MKKPKRRGPLPTGKGTLVGVRFQPADLKALDQWIRQQAKPFTRPEAIRQLVTNGLLIGEFNRSFADDRSPFKANLVGLQTNQLLHPKDFIEMKVERLPSKR
ncbi:MAG: hypothetical protein PS018_03975 [bacterium]|jgi:hypothetical protein|nr:hypothetical protein [bacterium]